MTVKGASYSDVELKFRVKNYMHLNKHWLLEPKHLYIKSGVKSSEDDIIVISFEALILV